MDGYGIQILSRPVLDDRKDIDHPLKLEMYREEFRNNSEHRKYGLTTGLPVEVMSIASHSVFLNVPEILECKKTKKKNLFLDIPAGHGFVKHLLICWFCQKADDNHGEDREHKRIE